jgi:predicted TIM-barrel fold metal-dependent hydrolase
MTQMAFPNFAHPDFAQVQKFQVQQQKRIAALNKEGMNLAAVTNRIDRALLVKVVYPDRFWHYREVPVNGQGQAAAVAQFTEAVKAQFGAEVQGEAVTGYALHMVVE